MLVFPAGKRNPCCLDAATLLPFPAGREGIASEAGKDSELFSAALTASDVNFLSIQRGSEKPGMLDASRSLLLFERLTTEPARHCVGLNTARTFKGRRGLRVRTHVFRCQATSGSGIVALADVLHSFFQMVSQAFVLAPSAIFVHREGHKARKHCGPGTRSSVSFHGVKATSASSSLTYRCLLFQSVTDSCALPRRYGHARASGG